MQTSGDSIVAETHVVLPEGSLIAGYRAPRSPWAKVNRRNFTAFGILFILGAAYESLYVVGILPLSILASSPGFTAQTMPWIVVMTLAGGAWLLLKGMRGFGDMLLSADSIITPGRTVRKVLRREPGLLPLDRVSGIRVVTDPKPTKFEIRYRADSGQERRMIVPAACTPDPNGFLRELDLRGIRADVNHV